MGLKSAAGEFFAKRWLKRAEQGKEGVGVGKAISYLKAHKRETSAILAAVAAGLVAMGPDYANAVNVLTYVVTFLAGAGFVDSDATHKAK